MSILEPMNSSGKKGRSLLVAGAVAAVAASICCGASLVLLALGLGGAWTGFSTAIEPYRFIFAGVTLLLLAFGFYRVYWAPRACASGCASSPKLKRQRFVFWVATALALGLMAVSWWLAPRC